MRKRIFYTIVDRDREEEGRQLICVVKKGKRFVCQPFPLCGSVRILYINYKDVNGKEGWECQRCGLSFKPRHATRAMRHVLKLKGGDIAICNLQGH